MLPGNVVNVSRIPRAHQNFLAEHDRAFAFILNETRLTQQAQQHINANAAFRSRTGNLVKRSVVNVMRTRDATLVRFSNDAPYAWAQDRGSGIHGPRNSRYVIEARRAHMLRFIHHGQVVFRRKVMHPGVKPTHFLETARAVATRSSVLLLKAAMQRAAKRFR